MAAECSEWARGVLTTSSWHGLEDIGVMCDAGAMIMHGEKSGAWPVSLDFAELRTASGLVAPGKGIVAKYASHPDACLSVVGDKYRATAPEEWRALVRAAVAAGAQPTGAFSLRDGTRVLATFEVGKANGLRTNLLLVDSFDGSMKLKGLFTAIRTTCANTLSARCLAWTARARLQLRHTASLETKVNVLTASIGAAITNGGKVRDAYHAAEAMTLTKVQALDVFDRLFPKASEEEGKAAQTRADNVRADARRAMWNQVNNVGPTLATIWNAATYLVDREADGTARKTRGGDALDSLLFGSRGARVAEISELIDVVLRDGTVQSVPMSQAVDMGADPKVLGKNLLAEIMGCPAIGDPRALAEGALVVWCLAASVGGNETMKTKRPTTAQKLEALKRGVELPVSARALAYVTEPGVDEKACLTLAAAYQRAEEGPRYCMVTWANQEKACAFYNARGLAATLDECLRVGGPEALS